jgi:hypothetical protein
LAQSEFFGRAIPDEIFILYILFHVDRRRPLAILPILDLAENCNSLLDIVTNFTLPVSSAASSLHF